MARIIVGMSGGVDSSVASAILVRQGHEVVGVTMEIWSGTCDPQTDTQLRKHGCYGPAEIEDTRDGARIAERIGIPFHVFDLREVYARQVLRYAREEYKAGRTPNPCARCNRTVKFAALLDSVREKGIEFDFFATGHYVRTGRDESSGRHLLLKGKSSEKDQSYFLHGLTQEQLSLCRFPLGEHTKAEVREMAREMGLEVHDKPESQDFADDEYSRAMGCGGVPGPILDREGNTLGEHKGLPRYTIGQRKGLGIAAAEPLYVVAIDPVANSITAGPREDLYSSSLTASGLNWISIAPPTAPFETTAKIRYAQAPADCRVSPREDGRVDVVFGEPQLAITPGQSIVFYDGDRVVGGGIINAPE